MLMGRISFYIGEFIIIDNYFLFQEREPFI